MISMDRWCRNVHVAFDGGAEGRIQGGLTTQVLGEVAAWLGKTTGVWRPQLKAVCGEGGVALSHNFFWKPQKPPQSTP